MRSRHAAGARSGVALAWLVALGVFSGTLYAVVAALSTRFVVGADHAARPIPTVLALLGGAFFTYLAALAVALRCRDDRRTLAVIVVGGLLFRATLIASAPIQEIDIYRYLWDGAATTAGVDPYRYSPAQVKFASEAVDLPDDLSRLVAARDASPAVREILHRVHYADLPTIYPPVSQAVFAFAVAITPSSADVGTRLTVMKAVLGTFDLATLAVVVALVRMAGMHTGWALAYAWCPLVMKEFSNSGHLDAIAVFLTTLSVYWLVRACRFALNEEHGVVRNEVPFATNGLALVAAGTLALAAGAKLYPVVLAPFFVLTVVRRIGWRAALAVSLMFGSITTVALWPMLPTRVVVAGDAAPLEEAGPPVPPGAIGVTPRDPSAGLKAFLRRWEMNDFLFMIVVENLRPAGTPPDREAAWFAVFPPAWRDAVIAPPAAALEMSPSAFAFLVTRMLTGIVFVVLALALAWRGSACVAPCKWCEVAFLTLAWFWLLSPTQNPWYWTWALPLVPFARGRAWLALSGLALLYYLRFWLSYHWPGSTVLASGYRGERFFDFVVTWIEFGPWFLWLAAEAWVTARQRSTDNDESPRAVNPRMS